MSVAVITAVSGLVSSEAVRLFADKGLDVISINTSLNYIVSKMFVWKNE